MKTGRELKEWRENNGLTQAQVAFILNAKQETVSIWEVKDQLLHPLVAERLVEFCNNPKNYKQPSPMPRRKRGYRTDTPLSRAVHDLQQRQQEEE